MNNCKSRVIVILGPTSSGKSEVAIKLAKKFGGEIISADSRQIYRGMDTGTGKIKKDFSVPKSKIKNQKSKLQFKNKKLIPYYSAGIKHYLIDIVNPGAEYNAVNFKKDAEIIIEDILSRGKLPIICGGTGFWIKAVVDNVTFPEVKPNKVLRNTLRNKTAEELFEMLKKSDPERAKNIDAKNKVRLIRAIEIARTLGSVPRYKIQDTRYNFLQIGIDVSKEKLHQNIERRLKKRFAAGIIEEVEKLKNPPAGGGLSWRKIQSFGLGYFWIPQYLQGKIHPVKSSQTRGAALPLFNMVKTKEELFEKIYLAEKKYAKRQTTWFQKDKRIKWLENYKNIEKNVWIFLEK